jgi:microcystin-dependent protein
MCDGRSLPTASYPDLFAALSYSYGGSGANFSLPDFRGRFARYNDNMGTGAAGRDTGRAHGSTQSDAMQGHNHSVTSAGGLWYEAGGDRAASGGSNVTRNTPVVGGPTSDGTNGTPRTASETRPINLSCNRIIKY